MINIIDVAESYALYCHRSTNHYYGDDEPYGVHLQMVYDYAMKYHSLLKGNTEYALAAAWTHDVIEDCRQTYNDVKKVCGEEVAEITYALTNEKGKNRKERANDKYYFHIRVFPQALFVKLCDRLANIKYSKDHKSRMLDAYRREYSDFKLKLYSDDFKQMFDEMEELLK